MMKIRPQALEVLSPQLSEVMKIWPQAVAAVAMLAKVAVAVAVAVEVVAKVALRTAASPAALALRASFATNPATPVIATVLQTEMEALNRSAKSKMSLLP